MDFSGVSVVIPVYNSEASLPILAERLWSVLARAEWPAEIILVNDGSRDGSWEVTRKLAAIHPQIRGINLMRNYGQHNALLCGIREARHDVIVTLDDDLQNPPEEVSRLLAKLGEGFDVVYGTPEREEHGLWRNLASRLTKLVLQRAMGAETARKISAFRAFRTKLRDAFADYRGSFVSVDVLLTWGTTRFSAIPVRHEPRRLGQSNYTAGKLVAHALNMVTGFSTFPLQVSALMGLVLALFGAFVLIYVLGRYLIQGSAVPGFPFLASLVAVFSGAQLLALGIIGEYLARMHFRLMDRASYLVRESTGPEAG